MHKLFEIKEKLSQVFAACGILDVILIALK